MSLLCPLVCVPLLVMPMSAAPNEPCHTHYQPAIQIQSQLAFSNGRFRDAGAVALKGTDMKRRMEVDGSRIVAVLDPEAFDFHVDAHEGYSRTLLTTLLNRIRNLGYEAMGCDECEPELLPNGVTRIYLVPIEPVDDMAVAA